jgi:hypothetical protein
MKSSLIISVLIVLVLILSYIVFNRETHIFDDTLFKKRESELKQRIDSLDKVLQSEIKSKTDLQNKIHYLDSLKQKIKYVYVIKEKEIDTASVPNLINKFKDVFAEGDSN